MDSLYSIPGHYRMMESLSSCSPKAATSSANASAVTKQHLNNRIQVDPSSNLACRMQSYETTMGTRVDTRDDIYAPSVGDSIRRNHFMSTRIPVAAFTPRLDGQEHPHGQHHVPTVKPMHPVSHNWYHPYSARWHERAGYRPIAQNRSDAQAYRGVHRASNEFNLPNLSGVNIPSNLVRPVESKGGRFAMTDSSQWRARAVYENQNHSHLPSTSSGRERKDHRYQSRVVIPGNVTIPKELSPPSQTISPTDGSNGKRPSNRYELPPPLKRSKGEALEGHFHKLDLLCSATLELGPLQENPSGCSCPKSKCIALYCDCFKAGRRCNPNTCSCLNCKNTVEESGANGARARVSRLCMCGCHPTYCRQV
jgi:Tesmin/TSO1-like CXC domain, cysteine-rich domain